MKLNILADVSNPKVGPSKRAINLIVGLKRLYIPYEICSDNYDYCMAMHDTKVFNIMHLLPSYTPIGPNVVHELSSDNRIANDFSNIVVQSNWIIDYMTWLDPIIASEKRFYEYPASVDIREWDIGKNRSVKYNALFYTKYQSDENRFAAEKLLKDNHQTFTTIKYGEYEPEELKKACLSTSYCIYNSCCEKSSNALLEILATGLPIYVIDSKKWIGDDKFDRATSAPHFSDDCGIIGTRDGNRFTEFLNNVNSNKYDPLLFVKDFSVEKIALLLIDIIERCYCNVYA